MLSSSYTILRPPVCGYYTQALASGLSPVQVKNHGITTFDTNNISVHRWQKEVFRFKVGKCANATYLA